MRQSPQPRDLPQGMWSTLLAHAFTLVDEIARHGISDPFWTFGGGTVLMLRYGHRLSKDIDIFVPDPQYLGFVSPRLSDVAERVTSEPASPTGSTQPNTTSSTSFVSRLLRSRTAFSDAVARPSVETSCSEPSGLPRPRGVRT